MRLRPQKGRNVNCGVFQFEMVLHFEMVGVCSVFENGPRAADSHLTYFPLLILSTAIPMALYAVNLWLFAGSRKYFLDNPIRCDMINSG